MINQDAFDKWESTKQNSETPGINPHVNGGTMDQSAFMSAMEEDCRERAERRKQYEKEAERLKLLGNEQFSAGSYDKAVDFYTSALNEVRYWTILWTNRAQAYIKLGKFEVC